MKKYNLFAFCLLFVIGNLFAVNALAQTPSQPISGGVVNGKALKLAKPAYPPAAKAVRASGAVNVQILIDEEGSVVSATAVSGHPLLRAAAEQAARESKFAPTRLNGQPVRVSGVVVYNFVPAETPLSWTQIGYRLAKAGMTKDFGENFPASSIAAQIPSEWTEEKEKANLLAQKQQVNIMRRKMEEAMKNRPTSTETAGLPPPPKFAVGNTVDYSKINEAEMVGELTQMIEARFAGDVVRGWYFNLGTLLGKTDAAMTNQNEFALNVAALRQHQAVAPVGIAPEVLTELQNFIALAEKNALNVAENEQMRKSLARLATANF
jgi:TonB family protein